MQGVLECYPGMLGELDEQVVPQRQAFAEIFGRKIVFFEQARRASYDYTA